MGNQALARISGLGIYLLTSLALLAGCGGSSDVRKDAGVEETCEQVRQAPPQVVASPVDHAGEAGRIAGAARSSADQELRDSGERFINGPDRASGFAGLVRRCKELGLA